MPPPPRSRTAVGGARSTAKAVGAFGVLPPPSSPAGQRGAARLGSRGKLPSKLAAEPLPEPEPQEPPEPAAVAAAAAMQRICTYEWCEWVFCVLNSRTIDVGGGLGPLLLPLADIMNHCSPEEANVELRVRKPSAAGSGGGLACVVATDVAPGTALQWAYSDYADDLYFLMYYGFPPPTPPDFERALSGSPSRRVSGEGASDQYLTSLYLELDLSSLCDNGPVESPCKADDGADANGSWHPQLATSADKCAAFNDVDAGRPPLLLPAALSAALESLGLPATPQLAFPVSPANPIPDMYVWAHRLRAIASSGVEGAGSAEAQLLAIAGGTLAVTPEQEVAAWTAIRESCEVAKEWYRAAGGLSMLDLGGPSWLAEFAGRVRRSALVVTERAIAVASTRAVRSRPSNGAVS